MSVFSMHDMPKLHFIFITQYLGPRTKITFHNTEIYTIDPPAFFFDRESTAKLFRSQGIRLSKDELDRVFCMHRGMDICNSASNHKLYGKWFFWLYG